MECAHKQLDVLGGVGHFGCTVQDALGNFGERERHRGLLEICTKIVKSIIGHSPLGQ